MQMRWTPFITAAVAMLATAKPASSIDGTSEQLVDMSIGLHPDNHDNLENTLHQISNPHHERYGKHLSREEAKSLLDPPAEASDSVKRWLSDQGVPASNVEDRGQWIRARVPSDLADILSEKGDGGYDKTSRSLALPESLRGYISTVKVKRSSRGIDQTTKRWSSNDIARSPRTVKQKRGHSKKDVDLEKCKEELTPACIRKIYNMDEPPARPHSNAIFGVPGFNGVCHIT